MKPVEKITKKASPNTRWTNPQRTIQVRKQSNFEVMRDAFTRRGEVCFRISMSVYAASGRYLGVDGKAITLIVPSIDSAEDFIKEFEQTVKDLAGRLGITATRNRTPL
jgi:hypothetical protein